MPTPQESLSIEIEGEFQLKSKLPPSASAQLTKTGGGELFIVDNSDDLWKGLKYLHDRTEIASAFDIATGFFEIGALLALEPGWQKLDKIRILLGDEMTFRTRQALLEGLRERTKAVLDNSVEQEKEANDFLAGVPAIVQGIRSGAGLRSS